MKVTSWKHGPKIVYIKGIHNTIADAISWLEYDPSVNQTAESYFTTKFNKNSKAVRDKPGRQSQKQWYKLKIDTNKQEDDIYPIMTKYTLKEIAEAQNKDQ